jgi:molecular chaperone HscB
MDPFDTLGVPARFTVSLRDLELRHRDLSRTLHPDRHVNAPAAERRLALSRAIEVNEAFRTLKNPVTRAEAVLARAGVVVTEANSPKPSPDLLMEMMEARETLADAVRDRDVQKVESLAKEMRAREDGLLTTIGQALDAAPTPFMDVVALLGELRYTKRFLDEVSAFEQLLEDAG